MKKTAFLLLILFCSQLLLGQTQPLFRIVQNDRTGYINEKGDIVIKPDYLSGNDFSDGLAAVRQNGLYGFIDETGKFIIKPAYDFATDFVKGLVVVFKDGKPIFINKNGETVLPTVYKALTFLDDRKGIITTHSNKQGVIDILQKKLLIDTIFSSIGDFKYGVAIVNEYLGPSKKRRKKRVAVIDSKGKFIVPFGKFEAINPFIDGFAVVAIEDAKTKDGSTDGVIDTKGNLLFKRPYTNRSYLDGDFYDGYAKMSLYKYWIPEKRGVLSTTEKYYEGFMNLNGEIVFNDTNYRYVKEFSSGRAFIKKENDDYILVDRNFKRIGNGVYRDILNDKFQDGYAIVETEDGYGIIDTLGNFIVKPEYDEIDRIGILEGYFFFFSTDHKGNTLYGISDLSGNVISKALISDFDRNGFTNGLLRVVINGKLAYLDKKGKIVWQQEDNASTELKSLNIDFMNRGYFYAYSSPKNSEADYYGGWATSSNTPQKLSQSRFPNNSLTLVIDTSKVDTFASKYLGYKLYMSNTTGDTISFNAQDSRLYLKLQAQDKDGEWRDIEYLPSSWCGNSYHTIELEPDAFWTFTIPNYQGEFQTRVRAELKFIDKANPKKQKLVYSNMISGSINPGQFWRKRIYYPSGLMDPYNE